MGVNQRYLKIFIATIKKPLLSFLFLKYGAGLWVDNLDYQSNTVIIAELVLRGRPQPVHKAPREIGGLFCFKAATGARSRKQTKSKKGNETHSGSLKSFG